MKNALKLFLFLLTSACILNACDKAEQLPFYQKGTAATLTSNVASIAAAPADSDNNVLTLSWTSPAYATDSATVKYIIQVDSAGRGFTNASLTTVTGALTYSYTAKQLNDILLGFGFGFGVAYSVDIRVISSYANNNDQVNSNTITVQMTPYKIPPKVQLPSAGALFIVGSATQGIWSNPVPVPSQQFTQVDETTYTGVFNLTGGGEYLILPENGSWDHKYAIADNTLPGVNTDGDFGYDLGTNFKGLMHRAGI